MYIDPDSKEKLPALSELVGEILPFSKQGKNGGLKIWKRPYTKDGRMSEHIIIATEVATETYGVSAQTLITWAKDYPAMRVAYGWWDMTEVLRTAVDANRFDRRKRS